MLLLIQPQGDQGIEIKFLGVARVWLDNNLELVEHLHPVGVVAVATIVRAKRGFDVSHVPWFRSQDAQHRGRVVRPRRHRLVIRLPEGVAQLSPVLLQGEDDLLEI